LNDRVRVTIESHIALVELNRPEKLNALDRESFEAIIDAGEGLAKDPAVRAVILTGAGESFCAGIDRSFFQTDAGTVDERSMQARENRPANLYQSAAMIWRELPVPVIAAIRGVAFGAGLQVALGADIRIATPQSQWSIMEIRWGIIPDMGIAVTLRQLVPVDRAKMLAWTGKVIDGTEASRIGLVTEVSDDPLATARVLAREIASRSPDAVRAIKGLLNNALDEPVDAALQREARLQLSLLGSANQREAVMANLSGRDPVFRNSQP